MTPRFLEICLCTFESVRGMIKGVVEIIVIATRLDLIIIFFWQVQNRAVKIAPPPSLNPFNSRLRVERGTNVSKHSTNHGGIYSVILYRSFLPTILHIDFFALSL